MRRTVAALLVAVALWQGALIAQTPSARPSTSSIIFIKAGRLLDVRAGRVLENQGILIENDRIKAVGPFDSRLSLIPHAPPGRSGVAGVRTRQGPA